MTDIKNSPEYLAQLGNLNFLHDSEALHITVTYNTKHLPASMEHAGKEADENGISVQG